MFRLQKAALLQAIAASMSGNQDIKRIRARYQLLGRMGYPEGANAGRGYRGGYDLDQVFKLIFCFQMIRFDFSLSRTIAVARASWPVARSAIAHSLPGGAINGHTFYWLGEPPRSGEFEDNQEGDHSKGGTDSRVITVMLDDGNPDHSLQKVARSELGLGCAWFVNVEDVVADVLEALADPALGIDQDELEDALIQWRRAA